MEVLVVAKWAHVAMVMDAARGTVLLSGGGKRIRRAVQPRMLPRVPPRMPPREGRR